MAIADSIRDVVRALQPRSAALPEMATAVLILNEDRQVEYVNDSSIALFVPVNPLGCTLPALFSSCEAKGGDDLFAAVDAGETPKPSQLRLVDDRLMDCTIRQLSSGGYVLTMDDVTSYARKAELAERDVLTGLANRKGFRDRLVERLSIAARAGQATAVLYVDLDRFKAVNDTLGHPVGDALLRKVADRFRSALRDSDVVARIGGDEFAIIQPDAPQPAAATALASRLVDLISRAYAVEGHMLHIGASIGVAIAPADGNEPDVLLKNADLALYRSKAEGRGRFSFFEPGMDNSMQVRRAMEIDLRRALALRELHLNYQPQYDLASGAIVGFEALLRWHHPTRGIVLPADFIPLADEIGVMTAIGEWVLQTACAEAASWPEPLSIAVNLSAGQLRSNKLSEIVAGALARSNLAAARLDLEITENALIDDADCVLQTLGRLKAIGASVVMDDFGTGFSSLGYLRRFPFDKIKIDEDLIRDVDTHVDRQAIIRAITDLAGTLDMRTIAEGVETKAELDCIVAAGCDQVQGYLTGAPISADHALALLPHASMALVS